MARKEQTQTTEEKTKFITITEKNKDMVYFSGNETIASFLGISTRQVMRLKKAGKFGISVDGVNYRFNDIAAYIKEYRPTATSKKDMSKHTEYWKALKTKMEVLQKRKELIETNFAGYIASNSLSMYHRSVEECIFSADFLTDENKQLLIAELTQQARNFVKSEDRMIEEILSKYEDKND